MNFNDLLTAIIDRFDADNVNIDPPIEQDGLEPAHLSGWQRYEVWFLSRKNSGGQVSRQMQLFVIVRDKGLPTEEARVLGGSDLLSEQATERQVRFEQGLQNRLQNACISGSIKAAHILRIDAGCTAYVQVQGNNNQWTTRRFFLNAANEVLDEVGSSAIPAP